MDEIRFRFTSQLETLQIGSITAAQQIYQLLFSWLSQGQQMLPDLSYSNYNQHVKDFGSLLVLFSQRAVEQIRYQFYHLQQLDFPRVFGGFCINDITKRDVVVCVTGLAVGGFVGYNIGVNWRHQIKRIQYMKAIICHHYSGIEGVSLIDDAEVPTVFHSNDVLIQVKVAAVNVVDAKICSGYSRVYRRLLNSGQQKELPVVLGRECAGIVADIGQNVVNFDIGDEVFLAIPSWASGTMAEYLVVPENQVAKKPKLISFEASACLPYSGCLAWNALVNESIIEEGNAKNKRILVCGGSTSVGCILIQLVKLWGGHVSVLCSLDAAKVIKALGADDVIAVNDVDIEKELELHEKFHAIFYTGGIEISDRILKKRLFPRGSFVATTPEYLASDTFGFVSGSIFAGCVRVQLLVQYVFGRTSYHWNEGAKIKTSYLDILRELVDANELQSVVGAAFRPNHFEQALVQVLNPYAIGSTIIKFN